MVANYTVTDEFGATAQSTLTITLTGTNDAPVATVLEPVVIPEDGLFQGTLGADFPISLLATDVDSTLTSASVSVTGAVFDGTPVTASEAGVSYDPQTGQFDLDFTQPLYQSLGQNLAQGEVKNLVVNLTITDDHGATTTQSPIFAVTAPKRRAGGCCRHQRRH